MFSSNLPSSFFSILQALIQSFSLRLSNYIIRSSLNIIIQPNLQVINKNIPLQRLTLGARWKPERERLDENLRERGVGWKPEREGLDESLRERGWMWIPEREGLDENLRERGWMKTWEREWLDENLRERGWMKARERGVGWKPEREGLDENLRESCLLYTSDAADE